MNHLTLTAVHLLLAGLALIAHGSDTPAPALPQFTAIPTLTRQSEVSWLGDILSHCRQPYFERDRATCGHETVHAINNELRNARGGNVQALYVLEGKAVLLREPQMRKSAVAPFVPASLRASRFRTYVAGGHDWEDKPTYLLDEWVAYAAGAMILVDDDQAGRQAPRDDRIGAPLEMGIYAVALGQAIERNDPGYLQAEPQFLAFLRWHWSRAVAIFRDGRDRFPSPTADALLRNLTNSPDAAAMRRFITTHLEGVGLQ